VVVWRCVGVVAVVMTVWRCGGVVLA
jgi:hypothetical protein